MFDLSNETTVTLIDESGRKREHGIDRRVHPPIVLIIAGVEYVRVSSRRGQFVYREVSDNDDDAREDETRADDTREDNTRSEVAE